ASAPQAAATHVLVTDCSTGFAAAVDGIVDGPAAELTLNGRNFDGGDQAPDMDLANASVYDIDAQLTTVSYFLRLESNAIAPGGLQSNLVRRTNGEDEVVAEGIERLDFLYHVQHADGSTQVLHAD